MEKGVDASVDSDDKNDDSTNESDVSSAGSDGSWDSEDFVQLADYNLILKYRQTCSK